MKWVFSLIRPKDGVKVEMGLYDTKEEAEKVRKNFSEYIPTTKPQRVHNDYVIKESPRLVITL